MAVVSRIIAEKIDALKRVGEKFEVLSAHDALFLLRNSFAIPKFQYLLRTAPCFKSEMLIEYDNTLRLILSEVTNTAVASDDRAWTQASLPVKLGGLGVRSAVELTPSAFLTSMNMNAALVEAILPTTLCSSTSPLMEDALSNWLVGNDSQPPTDTEAQRQEALGSSEVWPQRPSLRKVPRTTSTEHACWHRGPASLGHGCTLFLFQQWGCG